MQKRILPALLPFLLVFALLLSACAPLRPWLDGEEEQKGSSLSESAESTEAASVPPEPEADPEIPPPAPPAEVEPPSYHISVSHNPEEVTLVNRVVVAYLASDGKTPVSQFIKPFVDGGNYRENDLDRALPLTLSYREENKREGDPDVKTATLLLSQSSDMASPAVYVLKTGEMEISVYNLLTNATYYYSFRILFEDNRVIVTPPMPVRTADTRRFLYVDNVRNVRDIGGTKSSLYGGCRIRSAMMYRGHELDGLGSKSESDFKATPAAIETLEALGIKTDLDLRAIYNPVLPNATYMSVSLVGYTGAFESGAANTYGVILKSLADPANFPYYTHCTYGCDRTGTLFFMLGALLGVSEADLLKEYELSAFYHSTMSREYRPLYTELLNAFHALDGETTVEKAEGWARSLGVTDEEIASIRRNLLEIP